MLENSITNEKLLKDYHDKNKDIALSCFTRKIKDEIDQEQDEEVLKNLLEIFYNEFRNQINNNISPEVEHKPASHEINSKEINLNSGNSKKIGKELNHDNVHGTKSRGIFFGKVVNKKLWFNKAIDNLKLLFK